MAQAKRSSRQDAAAPVKSVTRAAIGICPVCSTLLGDEDAETHLLAQHRPPHVCGHCGKNPTEWRIDRDELHYPHRGCGIFLCKNCGIHTAPAHVTPPL
jgi:hypothetical protein